MYSEEIKMKFLELRIQNLSLDKISKEIKVSKQTLIKWNREFSSEITEWKETILEQKLEQYGLSVSGQLDLINERLNIIQKELDKKETLDLDPKELMQMEIQYMKQIPNILKPLNPSKSKTRTKGSIEKPFDNERKADSVPVNKKE